MERIPLSIRGPAELSDQAIDALVELLLSLPLAPGAPAHPTEQAEEEGETDAA